MSKYICILQLYTNSITPLLIISRFSSLTLYFHQTKPKNPKTNLYCKLLSLSLFTVHSFQSQNIIHHHSKIHTLSSHTPSSLSSSSTQKNKNKKKKVIWMIVCTYHHPNIYTVNITLSNTIQYKKKKKKM